MKMSSVSAKLDFSSMSIYNMNSQYPWNNTITNSCGLDDNTTYNLHATDTLVWMVDNMSLFPKT